MEDTCSLLQLDLGKPSASNCLQDVQTLERTPPIGRVIIRRLDDAEGVRPLRTVRHGEQQLVVGAHRLQSLVPYSC